MSDMEEVIRESVEDATQPEETPETVEASPEVVDTEDVEQVAVKSPAAAHAEEQPEEAQEAAPEGTEAPQDDFDKKYGVSAQSLTGRENRIPYSRVKKITEKAVSEIAEAALGRKLTAGEKAADVVKAHVAQIPELTAKVTDYEAKLDRFAQFENIIANQPEQFLQHLSTFPVYQPFFKAIDEMIAKVEQYQSGAPAAPAASAPVADPLGDMPQPDDTLADGSKAYSQQGIRALLDWNAKQTESRVLKQIEERYKPIEDKWQTEQRMQAIIPKVQAQVTEARKWPMFVEHEAEIVKLLQQDQNISLEGAYRQVVYPRLVADKEKMRQDLLKEIKQAPRATSLPSSPAKPVTPVNTGPRDLADVIAESIKGLKG